MGFFNIRSVVAKLRKIEGRSLWEFFWEKTFTIPRKKREGGPLVLLVTVLRGKKGKNLFVSVPWATRYKLRLSLNFVEFLVDLLWTLQVYRKKH